MSQHRRVTDDGWAEAMAGATPDGLEGEANEGPRNGRSDWRYIYGRLNLGWKTPWHDITVQSPGHVIGKSRCGCGHSQCAGESCSDLPGEGWSG